MKTIQTANSLLTLQIKATIEAWRLQMKYFSSILHASRSWWVPWISTKEHQTIMVAPNASKFNEQVDQEPPQKVKNFDPTGSQVSNANILHVSRAYIQVPQTNCSSSFSYNGQTFLFWSSPGSTYSQLSYTSPAPAVATYISNIK